jgi:hypothetical protein
MASVSYTILKRRQKMHIRAYAILCLILFVSIGFYSYKKWQEYSFAKDAVSAHKEFISILRDSVANEKSTYELEKTGFNNLNKEIEEKLTYIFPPNDGYTAMTRQMDIFEEELAKKNNPFEISSIDFQSIQQNENYSVLPIRMSIKSSSENFTKFLHQIENSGSLTNQIRLMDISSIRLNFQESSTENKSEMITFTVQINAYFQK